MNPAVVSFSLYTLILIAIGLWSYKLVEKVPLTRYEEEFYAAGRGLGGIIVALIIAGSLASAGTFIAGPGMTYAYGYSWVLINNFQIFMNLLLLAPIGIIVGVVARRINAVTYLDLFKARYESRFLTVLLTFLVTFFLLPYMATQFVGAARVISQMTGLGYIASLAFGSTVVLIYCVLGGMRGTSLATAVQGIVITAGSLILFVATVKFAGGFRHSTEVLLSWNPDFLSPTMHGKFPPLFAFSVAALTGFFVVGMPHAMLGALSYKNTRALKRGIWMGGIIVFLWTLPLCMAGVIGRAIKPDLKIPDEIAPWLAMHVMPESLGGIVLAGIVAGIQTTVAAMAIIITSSIARNLLKEINVKVTAPSLKTISRITMGSCLLLAIALALSQPKLIQWIIFFSIGGLESATFGPILIGFFWKRGNKWGAIVSVVFGTVLYGALTLFSSTGIDLKVHPSLISVSFSSLLYVGVSLLTPPPPEKVKALFWGRGQENFTGR